MQSVRLKVETIKTIRADNLYTVQSSLISAVLFSGSARQTRWSWCDSFPSPACGERERERRARVHLSNVPPCPSEALRLVGALVSTVLIATLLISALGLCRSRIARDTRTYTRSDAMSAIRRTRTPCERVSVVVVVVVRVREIMRPPTNQSIRRHLSDCSLTSVCPAPPPRRLFSLHVRTPYRHRSLHHRGSSRLPEADRCQTPTRTRDRVSASADEECRPTGIGYMRGGGEREREKLTDWTDGLKIYEFQNEHT